MADDKFGTFTDKRDLKGPSGNGYPANPYDAQGRISWQNEALAAYAKHKGYNWDGLSPTMNPFRRNSDTYQQKNNAFRNQAFNWYQQQNPFGQGGDKYGPGKAGVPVRGGGPSPHDFGRPGIEGVHGAQNGFYRPPPASDPNAVRQGFSKGGKVRRCK